MREIDYKRPCGASTDALRADLSHVLDDFGFEYGCLLLLNSLTGELLSTSTYPKSWKKLYTDMKFFTYDPLIHVVPLAAEPLDLQTIKKFDRLGFLTAFNSHGLGDHGLAVPIRGELGEVAVFAGTLTCTDAEWDDFLTEKKDGIVKAAQSLHAQSLVAWGIDQAEKINPLTDRQREVLQLSASGIKAKEVAAELGLSSRTVEYFLSQCRKRLNASSTSQAIARGIALGVIHQK